MPIGSPFLTEALQGRNKTLGRRLLLLVLGLFVFSVLYILVYN